MCRKRGCSVKNGTPDRPVKELKGFTKVMLEAGETKTISLEICARDLSFYHEGLRDWYAPSGWYEIAVGHASDDIRLTKEISFETKKQLPFRVDGATTVGEILADPRTAGVMAQMLEAINNAAKTEEGQEAVSASDSESDAAMMKALLDGMPMKSLISFGVPGEQVEAIITQLDALCR